jgi:hypothetical protein
MMLLVAILGGITGAAMIIILLKWLDERYDFTNKVFEWLHL